MSEWMLKSFRELSVEELYRILQIRTKVFVVEQQCAYQEVDGKDIHAYHLFKMENEAIVAYARLLPEGVSYPEASSIGRVLVAKEHRGNGLAKELLSKSIAIIQEEFKQKNIKIQGQHYLEKFYQSFGFQSISDVYIDDQIPHVDMILPYTNKEKTTSI